jgi:hypothetical protein
MYAQRILLFALCLCYAVGLPQDSFSAFFTDPSIPFLRDSDFLDDVTLDINPNSNSSSTGDDSSTLERRVTSVPYVKYSITLDGRNRGNYENFYRSGYLWVCKGIRTIGTTNGANPYEVVIKVGASPASSPNSGSIYFLTNAYLSRVLDPFTNLYTGLDFVYETYTQSTGTLKVTIDELVAGSNENSMFNARTGPLKDVYRPSSGVISVRYTAKNGIVGGINIHGRGEIYSSTTGVPFVAAISGTVVGRGTFTF